MSKLDKVQKNTLERYDALQNFNKNVIQQDIIIKKRERLEQLKEDISHFKMENKEEADKIIKRYHKRKTIQGICSLALGAILSTLSTKKITHGYPFYIDDIKYYRENDTIIDEDINVEVRKRNYRTCEHLATINKKIDLYHFPASSRTLTGGSIQYVEKYSVEGLTAEEIVDLLKEDKLDLKSFGEPEIISHTYEFDMDTSPFICFTTLDQTDFIVEPETSEQNTEENVIFIYSTACYGILLAVVTSGLYKTIFKESETKVEIAKELIEEYNQQIEKANQLEEKIAKLERSIK